MKKAINIEVPEVNVKHCCSNRNVALEFEAAPSDLLTHFSAEEIVQHFNIDELLDAMDEGHIREYIGVPEQEA